METTRTLKMADLASVVRYCDQYLQRKYNTNFVELMNLEIDNNPEIIMMLLIANSEINKLFDTYGLHEIMYNFISEFSNKKIFYISNTTLEISRKKAIDLSSSEYSISEGRLDAVFKALEKNLSLYERLYKDKIWIVESSLGTNDRIMIKPERFFHLMGFDEKDFGRDRNPDALSKFTGVFNNPNKIRALMKERKDLLGVLYSIIDEQNKVKEAILDGRLHGVINPQKLEMKNYGFERIQPVETSSGMIFFDRQLATRLAGVDEKGKPKFQTNIQGDLILLSNFIRQNQLDFIFEPFRYYSKDNGQSRKPFKNAESLIIPKDGYEKSNLFIGQQSSISESARSYAPKDFEYTIKQEDGSEEPVASPQDYIEYSDEDKAQMAKAIIEGLPQLDNEHLLEVYKNIMGSKKL